MPQEYLTLDFKTAERIGMDSNFSDAEKRDAHIALFLHNDKTGREKLSELYAKAAFWKDRWKSRAEKFERMIKDTEDRMAYEGSEWLFRFNDVSRQTRPPTQITRATPHRKTQPFGIGNPTRETMVDRFFSDTLSSYGFQL